ncbi:MAG: hypothetical protein VYD90_06665 [Pseudomonadota bacterium]|nr:hypothetical protein [Pseudomonadota bacterium]
MTISVYEVGDYLGEPLTIFAQGDDEAEHIFREWMAKHRLCAEPDMPIVHVYAGRILAARTHLQVAADRGETGVGYWDGTNDRWRIESPRAEMTHSALRPQTRINCYRVEVDDGLMYLAFAKDVGIATSFLIDACASGVAGMKVQRLSPLRFVSTMATLRDDMESGVEGLASWSSERGWRVTRRAAATEVSGFVF